MQRTLSVERLYSLGDFKNIKFTDTITDIPQELSLNPNAMKLISYLQLTEIELSHKRYIKLGLMLPARPDQIDATLELIEEERSRTFTELLEEINKEK